MRKSVRIPALAVSFMVSAALSDQAFGDWFDNNALIAPSAVSAFAQQTGDRISPEVSLPRGYKVVALERALIAEIERGAHRGLVSQALAGEATAGQTIDDGAAVDLSLARDVLRSRYAGDGSVLPEQKVDEKGGRVPVISPVVEAILDGIDFFVTSAQEIKATVARLLVNQERIEMGRFGSPSAMGLLSGLALLVVLSAIVMTAAGRGKRSRASA